MARPRGTAGRRTTRDTDSPPANDHVAPRRTPGRPRLTPDEWRERLEDYCRRYSVAARDDGLPPFPSGQRESPQHREWMALYKAHRRLAERGTDAGDLERRQLLLASQRGRCTVCRSPLELGDSRLDDWPPGPAVLHGQCLELVSLARMLGPDAVERAKGRC